MDANSEIALKPFILVVDDEAFMRELFAATLRDAGFLVETVGSGSEALDFFAHTLPDLVLLDLLMPEFDGLATCTALRRLPEAAFVPIVMLTAQNDHEAVRLALEAGVNDFMSKPVPPELLVHRLRYALHSSRTLQHLAESRTRLTDAQRIARLGNWEWRVATNSLWWSEEIAQILAPLPVDFARTAQAFFALIHPDDRQRVANAFGICLDERAPIDDDFRLILADGGLRFVHLRGEVAGSPIGRPERVVGIMQDVSERRCAENQLQVLKEAIETLPIGITISDESGGIIYANSAEARMHGFTIAELLQSKARDLAPGRMERALPPGELPTLKLWQRESVNHRKDGSEFP
ncbi:MAG TPA: hypothetical protein DCF93_05400, partial [Desulfuromonas sp.]|nr:hypothetical protein [Desulfuromonas sp.]